MQEAERSFLLGGKVLQQTSENIAVKAYTCCISALTKLLNLSRCEDLVHRDSRRMFKAFLDLAPLNSLLFFRLSHMDE